MLETAVKPTQDLGKKVIELTNEIMLDIETKFNIFLVPKLCINCKIGQPVVIKLPHREHVLGDLGLSGSSKYNQTEYINLTEKFGVVYRKDEENSEVLAWGPEGNIINLTDPKQGLLPYLTVK